MVTCLRMPEEKPSDDIWVTECCRVAWEGSAWLHLLSLLLFLWWGKQLLFIQLCFDSSARLIFIDSLTRGLYTTVFCPEYWPHTNPLPCFGFCLSWERVSFCRPGWPGLCLDQAGLKLRAICHLCLSSTGTTNVHRHIWPLLCFESTSDSVSE